MSVERVTNKPGEDLRAKAAAADPDDSGAEKWSYFGWAERPYFQAMRKFRYDLFRPLLLQLARLGIKPNHVTAASFIVVLVGFPLFYGARQYGLAFAALARHIALDGFDGPLARTLKQHGTAQGALMDMSNDVTGMVIVVLTVSFFHQTGSVVPVVTKSISPGVNIVIGTVYVITYLYLTIFAVAQNILGLRYAYVLKTKYTVYILLMCKWLFGFDLVTPVMALSSVYMGLSAFFGFLRVARTLR